MPTYTLGELQKLMEPQAQRDKALIGRCVDGLGLYAAQIAEGDRFSPKIEATRKLAENLIGYWGLGDSYLTKDARPMEEFMRSFDSRVDEARSGGLAAGDIRIKPIAHQQHLLARHARGLQGHIHHQRAGLADENRAAARGIFQHLGD